MLSKDVCSNCRGKFLGSEGLSIEKLDGWYCYPKNSLNEDIWLTPDDNPPKECPHKLEHAVSLGMKDDKR